MTLNDRATRNTPLMIILAVFAIYAASRLIAQDAKQPPPRVIGIAQLEVAEGQKTGDDAVEDTNRAAREQLMKRRTADSMKQIMLAMFTYHDSYNKFPPAFSSANGKPLLSWRVAILPFLNQGPLYKEFHLDEPWDSDHNKPLIGKMPDVYRGPMSKHKDGRTVYLTPRGETTAFPGAVGMKLSMIVDGTSNTIAVVEVDDEYAVPWTKPDDWAFDADDPKAELGGQYTGGFHVAYCDGSVKFVPDKVDGGTLKALFTRNGRENVRPPN
jgi:hypothetical protein